MIIISDKPNFYKTNLFNEINKIHKLIVVYVGEEKIKRGEFFYSKNMDFEHVILSGSKLKKIISLIKILFLHKNKKIIVGGWDNIYYAIVLIFFRSVVIVESTAEDKNRKILLSRLKYFIKKLILFRVEKFICAGYKHQRYVASLCPNKKSVVSKSVGFPFASNIQCKDLSERKDFVYIGRNSPEKNIDFMVDVFNKSDLSQNNKLYLVGDNFDEYKNIQNITIVSKVSRDEMAHFLSKFKALFLMSTSEPYGLVIEEAFRCGIPAIISSKCGIVETLAFDGVNCIVLNVEDKSSCIQSLNIFFELEEELIKNIYNMQFDTMDKKVLGVFCE